MLPLWLQESGPGAVGGAAGIWFSRQGLPLKPGKIYGIKQLGNFPRLLATCCQEEERGKKKVGRWICCLPLGLGGEWAPSQHQTLVSLGFWVFRLKSLWQMSFKVSEFAFNPAL